jgi:hypothetical protein
MFDRSQFLKQIKNSWPHLGILLETMFENVDVMANHLGMDMKGRVAAPPTLAGLNVAAGSDHVHVTINDASTVKKNIHYFVEWSANDPTFASPNVEHLGASRGRVLALPAKNGSGATNQYYFRAYSQYLGSDPAQKQAYFGTVGAPTAVTLTGASTLNLLQSTGSGTASGDGSQGGYGLGRPLERPIPGPKRPITPKIT